MADPNQAPPPPPPPPAEEVYDPAAVSVKRPREDADTAQVPPAKRQATEEGFAMYVPVARSLGFLFVLSLASPRHCRWQRLLGR